MNVSTQFYDIFGISIKTIFLFILIHSKHNCSIILKLYNKLAANTKLQSLLSARKYVAVGIQWRDRLINHEPTPSIPPSVGAKTNGCLATRRGGGAHTTRYRIAEPHTRHTRSHTHTSRTHARTRCTNFTRSVNQCEST